MIDVTTYFFLGGIGLGVLIGWAITPRIAVKSRIDGIYNNDTSRLSFIENGKLDVVFSPDHAEWVVASRDFGISGSGKTVREAIDSAMKPVGSEVQNG